MDLAGRQTKLFLMATHRGACATTCFWGRQCRPHGSLSERTVMAAVGTRQHIGHSSHSSLPNPRLYADVTRWAPRGDVDGADAHLGTCARSRRTGYRCSCRAQARARQIEGTRSCRAGSPGRRQRAQSSAGGSGGCVQEVHSR